MSSKVWSIGLQKQTKMIQYHVHIRYSTTSSAKIIDLYNFVDVAISSNI